MRSCKNPSLSEKSSHCIGHLDFAILSGFVIRISALVTGFAEMFVGEVEEDLPVLFGHRMFAWAEVISERAVNQLSHFRRLVGVQPLRPATDTPDRPPAAFQIVPRDWPRCLRWRSAGAPDAGRRAQ